MPDVEIPDITITEHVLRMVDQLPDRPALVDGPSGRTYTFAQLADLVHRFAGGLRARGFGKGDVVALMAPNAPEYAIVFHGVAVAGGTVTTVNPTYGAEEVRFQLLPDFEDAFKTQQVLEAAVVSAEQRRPVKIEEMQ